jgi:hypothetical protein
MIEIRPAATEIEIEKEKGVRQEVKGVCLLLPSIHYKEWIICSKDFI